ncbi:MAG: hypothetical protein ACKVJU_11995 [Verrucomicrobiales bacterium]
MAGLKDADDFRDGEHFKGGGLLKFLLLGGGVLFAIIFIVLAATGGAEQEGGYSRSGAMAYSWLFAIVFFLTLSIGGIFWTLLHHASNSGWGIVVRRMMENIGTMVLFVLILGIPLVTVPTFKEALWEWIPLKAALDEKVDARYEEGAVAKLKGEYEAGQKTAQSEFDAFKAQNVADQAKARPGAKMALSDQLAKQEADLAKVTEHDLSEGALKEEIAKEVYLDHHDGNYMLWKKRGYLNEGAWTFRFVLYFIALVGIIYALRFWSVKNDKDGDPKWFLLQRKWACGFLPFFATAWTFLVFDWLMALDYTWFSTMWGVYLFAGSALNSMALLILVVTVLMKAGYLKKVVTPEHYLLMGRLLFAFTVFWGYIAFSQFFLIWYANITEETRFYLQRNADFWNTYTILALVVGHFFIPFLMLLIQQAKKNLTYICTASAWILCMHVLDIYWIIIPERGPSLTDGGMMTIPGAIYYDVIAFLAVGGIFGFFFLWRLGTASLFPCRDPRLDESLNVVN